MKALIWGLVAILGLGLMVLTYDKMMRCKPGAPWASGFIVIGAGEAARPVDSGTVVAVRLRLLPASAQGDALLKSVASSKPLARANLPLRIRSKLIELPIDEMRQLAGWLREGRLPEPGQHEVLAGSQSPAAEPLSVAGETLKVVGVLQPGVALFADCYLAPPHPSLDAGFAQGDADVHDAKLWRLKEEVLYNRKQLKEVMESFPASMFTTLMPQVRPEPQAFLAYLAAQALFLLGGTGVLISLYSWLAVRNQSLLLAAPLQEMIRRPRLLWAVHLVYFGLFLVGALIIYQLPNVHTVLMAAVQGELSSEGKGVLAVAGRAYGTGNMVYAAAVTFVINFFFGSLGVITIPSMIVPGCGVLVASFRATLWGLLLGPSENSLAMAMLPHSGTLLLEGAGYILAAFFAILIPIYLFRSSTGEAKPPAVEEWASLEEREVPLTRTTGQRFRNALMLNLQGNVLVAIVLAAAACYEAVEVILVAGF